MRQLWAMAQGRRKHDWDVASGIRLSIHAAMNGKKGMPPSWVLNPMLEKPKPIKVGIAAFAAFSKNGPLKKDK